MLHSCDYTIIFFTISLPPHPAISSLSCFFDTYTNTLMHHYVDATTNARNPNAIVDDRNLNTVTGRLAAYVGEQELFMVMGM